MTQHVWVVEVENEAGKWHPAYDGTATCLTREKAMEEKSALQVDTNVKYRVKKYIRQG